MDGVLSRNNVHCRGELVAVEVVSRGVQALCLYIWPTRKKNLLWMLAYISGMKLYLVIQNSFVVEYAIVSPLLVTVLPTTTASKYLKLHQPQCQ